LQGKRARPRACTDHHQRGTVLVVVLLIVAFIAVIATENISRVVLDNRRSINIRDTNQAYYYALGAEELALQILKKSFDDEKKKHSAEVVSLGQPWARKGMVFPIEGGQLAGQIRDMSACFNINSIMEKIDPNKSGGTSGRGSGGTPPGRNTPDSNTKKLPGQILLEVLLRDVLTDSEQSPEALAARVRDWLDPDQDPFGADGAEDSTYLALQPPYRTGNTLMGSVEELRTIAGFTAESVEIMAPYLCALPSAEMKTINVNTIDVHHPALLAMLYKNMSIEKAQSILDDRPANGYDDDSYQQKLGAGQTLRAEAKDVFSLTSDRFLINSEAIVQRGHARLQSLVQRGDDGNFEVISRRFASDFQ